MKLSTGSGSASRARGIHADRPILRVLARRFLEAEADRRGVPLNPASVLARRAEGEPEMHITAAAEGGRRLCQLASASPAPLHVDRPPPVLRQPPDHLPDAGARGPN